MAETANATSKNPLIDSPMQTQELLSLRSSVGLSVDHSAIISIHRTVQLQGQVD